MNDPGEFATSVIVGSTPMTGRLDSVDTYNPASYRGGVLQLHYARAQELGLWLDRVAVRGEVVVQFWFRPGEAAVTLGTGAEREVEQGSVPNVDTDINNSITRH